MKFPINLQLQTIKILTNNVQLLNLCLIEPCLITTEYIVSSEASGYNFFRIKGTKTKSFLDGVIFCTSCLILLYLIMMCTCRKFGTMMGRDDEPMRKNAKNCHHPPKKHSLYLRNPRFMYF